MAAILLNHFIKLAVFYQLLFSCTKIKAHSKNELKQHPCTGKHQIAVELPAVISNEKFEPLRYRDFDQIPSETILENNAHFLVINVKYNDTVPTVKVNFEQTLGVRGTFRLEFLYFQWFRKVATSLAYENLTFPGEFHGLFFNVNAKNLEHAFTMDKGVIILAFQIKVNPLENLNFAVLQENLKYVQEEYSKTAIPNHNLDYWFQAEMQNFYVYEGSFPYVCFGKVIFIDFTDVLHMSAATVKEFQKLKASDVKPLMMEISQTIKPQGKVFKNDNQTKSQLEPAGYYYDYDDDDEEDHPVIQIIVIVLFIIFSLLLIIRVYKYW